MADPSGDPQAHDIAVIGCGLMGAALARTLAGHGHTVAAWNRTPERAGLGDLGFSAQGNLIGQGAGKA